MFEVKKKKTTKDELDTPQKLKLHRHHFKDVYKPESTSKRNSFSKNPFVLHTLIHNSFSVVTIGSDKTHNFGILTFSHSLIYYIIQIRLKHFKKEILSEGAQK